MSTELPQNLQNRDRESGEKRAGLYGPEQLGNISLPVRGETFIRLLTSAEVGEGGQIDNITSVLERTRAYLEGLPDKMVGVLNFDPGGLEKLHVRQALAFLRDLFLTVEGASERPNAPYVETAEEDLVDRLMVDVSTAFEARTDEESFRQRLASSLRERGLTEEEIKLLTAEEVRHLADTYLAGEKILSLLNYIEARSSLDDAFRQRVATCENPEQAAKLGGEIRAVSPDGPTWESLFKNEKITDFGQRVDEIWLEIVKFGLSAEACQRLGFDPIPPEIRSKVCKKNEKGVFADGFKDTESFAYFIKYLLDKAENRLDVVWAAWRLFLLWEVPSDLGVYVENGGKYVVGSPSICSALLITTGNLEAVRRKEFGLDASGKRTQFEKFVNKSGLPLTFGEIPDLCRGFLKETKISFGKEYMNGDSPFKQKLRVVLERIRQTSTNPSEYEKIGDLQERVTKFLSGQSDSIELSLWELRLYGGWGFSDEHFPWMMTDQTISQESEAGEIPAGAFGAWLAKRSRAFSVLSNKDGSGVLDVPKLDSLASQEFYFGALRNWTKLFGGIKENTSPEKNPRAWVLLAWLNYYRPGLPGDLSPAEKQKPFAAGIRSQRNNVFQNAVYVDRGIGLGAVLEAAIRTGWIRPVDADWIQKMLDIRVANYSKSFN